MVKVTILGACVARLSVQRRAQDVSFEGTEEADFAQLVVSLDQLAQEVGERRGESIDPLMNVK